MDSIGGIKIVCSEYLPGDTVVVGPDLYLLFKDPEAWRAKHGDLAGEAAKLIGMIKASPKRDKGMGTGQ